MLRLTTLVVERVTKNTLTCIVSEKGKIVFEIVKSGGWLMVPIILSSIIAVAIIIERFWSLQTNKIVPKHLLAQVWSWLKSNQLNGSKIKEIKADSALGEILAAGLSNSAHGREIMKDSIEEAANHVIHELEKFLAILGTIASITPLLGLLGTVVGMIKVFTAIMVQGTGNPAVLAGGISEALVTTAAGLTVAIPTMMFHRYFQRKIDGIVIDMEKEAIKLVDALHGDRQIDDKS